MKIALFFVALIAGSLAQSNSNNNNCLLGSGAPGSTCATNNQCAYGLSCVNGLCNFVNLGQTCSADTQCGGLYPFCIGGRCDAKRIPGDPCSMNEQCISNMCSGTCMARQLNQACGGSDCAPGLFCSPLTRVCTSKIAVGASCSNEYLAMVSNISFAHDLSVMCADSALCDYNPNSNTNTGICTPIFSATQGSCGAFGSLTCPVGSTCNQNTCSSGSNNNQCVSNAQCGITTFCACSGNSGNNNFQVFTSSSNVHAGVSRQLAGANVGSQGASANVAGAGANVGTQGVAVGTSQTGAAVGTQGVAVGSGQTGAAVGTQGAAVGTGQTGAAVGTQGATVQTGQTGAAVGTQGAAVGTQGTTVVVGPNGAIAGQGTTVIVTTNFKGNCQSDQCLNTYAPDYYSCLLQNGCGLSSSPLFINGTCASKCAYLYSRIQCCQAGFQPIVSSNTGNSNSNSNSGSNGLQRSIALPPQVQCVQFSQPPQAVSSAGALESGVVVLAALMAGLVF